MQVAKAVMQESGQDRLSDGTMIELPRAARFAPMSSPSGRVLLLRHQRSDADDLRHFARRCFVLPRNLSQKGIIEQDPFVSLDIDGVGELVRIAAEKGRRRARHQARHLRRAWRRPGVDRLLRGSRSGLRVLLALPRADRPLGGGAGVPPLRLMASCAPSPVSISVSGTCGISE
jgi:hypothetical protein